MSLADVLIVLTAIALALALGVRELAAARRRAAHGLLRAELRRLAVAQESFYYDHRTYAGDVAELSANGFRPTPGLRVTVREATSSGWSATALQQETGAACALLVRAAAPVGGARTPGEIHCD